MMNAVYALILTAVAAAVMELVLPAGSPLSASVKGVVGVCLLFSLLVPIKEGIALIRDVAGGELSPPWKDEIHVDEEDYQDILREELVALGEKEVAAWVGDTLQKTFGISKDNHTCTVIFSVGEDGITPVIRQVTVVLTGKAIFENPHTIETYLSERLGCECAVAIGRKEGM